MKLSQFNYQKIKNDEVILFNTLSRAIIKIPIDIFEELQKDINNFNNFELIKILKDNNFIVDDSINEFYTYKYWFNSLKYQRKYLTITYLTTYLCNFNCVYCFEGNSNEIKGNHLSINDIKEFLLNTIKYISPKFIDFNFFGGEPLMDIKSLKEIAQFLKCIENDLNIKSIINIVSNGYLITPTLLSDLKKLNVKSFQITIDGLANEHDKRRFLKNNDTTFNKIYENLLLLIKENFEVIINMNFDSKNYISIIKFLEFFPIKYRNKVFIKFSPLKSTENNCKIMDKLDSVELAEISNLLIKSLNNLGYANKELEMYEYGPCLSKIKNSLIIDPYGNISKCIFGIGNPRFTKCNILDINKNKYLYNMLFSEHEYKINYLDECYSCSALPLCMGGCTRENIEKDLSCSTVNCKKETLEKSIVAPVLDYY